jgi:endonuclease/exonuclease/phosphatase family metal-dependent hydrolase
MKNLSTFWRVILAFTLFSIQTAGAQSYDFKITTWNVEWLSCLSNGPSDRELQINNVVSMIKTMNSDLLALQEVGTSNLYTTMDTLVRRLGNEWAGDIVPWRVGNCNQNQGIIYKKSKVKLINSSLVINGGFSYDWSSGRFPALYNVNFVVGDEQIPITFINIHAKAYSDQESYKRRRDASIALKDALDGSIYSTEKLLIIGDFNDYLIGTTCNSCGGVSPYQNFMNDVAHYKGVTSELTTPYTPTIDNIIISYQLFDNYLPNSAFREVDATQTIPNYRSTTSDHTPVSITVRLPNGVSVADTPAQPAFSVYPNPTTGELTIDMGDTGYETMRYEICDMYGRNVSYKQVSSLKSQNLISINISHLSAGIYFMKVDNQIVKIVKQ